VLRRIELLQRGETQEVPIGTAQRCALFQREGCQRRIGDERSAGFRLRQLLAQA